MFDFTRTTLSLTHNGLVLAHLNFNRCNYILPYNFELVENFKLLYYGGRTIAGVLVTPFTTCGYFTTARVHSKKELYILIM